MDEFFKINKDDGEVFVLLSCIECFGNGEDSYKKPEFWLRTKSGFRIFISVEELESLKGLLFAKSEKK